MDAKIVDSGPLTIAGLQRRYDYAAMAEIPKLWQVFGPQIGHVLNQVGAIAYGVCSNADDTGFHYLAGVEVSDRASLPSEYSIIEWPAHRYAVFEHEGHVSGLSKTVDAIWHDWLPTSGYQHDRSLGMLERYGEQFDPHTQSGDVQVWVPILD